MEWPANLPDLNSMENLWGILCRTVYAEEKQYTNIGELRTSIISAWENLNAYVLQKLVNGMCDRVFKVFVNRTLLLAINASGCIILQHLIMFRNIDSKFCK